MTNLYVDVAGVKMKNPVMLAAGVLGLSGLTLRRVAEAGAGAVVTKSVSLKSRTGYSNPTIVDVGCGFLNAMGLPNPGIKQFVKEIRYAKTGGVPVLVSVYGDSPRNFAKVALEAERAGADAIELNISCPHVKGVGIGLGQDPDLVTEIVNSVKSRVEIPVFTKLTPNVSDLTLIAKAAEKGGSDGITAVNTVRAMSINVETGIPILANKIGGLSGPAIKPIAVRAVYEIAKSVNIPIIGCGGIMNWRDAVEFILAGSSAVQIGTAIAYKGLKVFKEISTGISSYLEMKKYGGVKEIVGLAHRC